MDETSSPDYEFGGFRLDTTLHSLVGPSGQPIALQSRAFATLRYLVERAGELVEKQSLMQAVWPKVVVEENNLSQCIVALRKALGETADERRFILTVPGRGYKFVAPVRVVQHERASHPVDAAPPTVGAATVGGGARRARWLFASAGILVVAIVGTIAWLWHAHENTELATTSIAVLPFVNSSSDPEQGYFSDGLSEELQNRLAQLPQLRVIGRTSSFAFKGKNEDLRHIGEILGVKHILEGSVRKAGNRVIVGADLVDSADGSRVWSGSYQRTVEDVLEIQEDIARRVAFELQVRMTPVSVAARGTKNIAAYDEYLVGQSMANSDSANPSAAVSHLERAVALDPGFVPAWLWLIDYYTDLAGDGSIQDADVRRRFNAAIDRVITLAPNSPEASFALSYRVSFGQDLQRLERLMTDSVKLRGAIGAEARGRYGQFLMATGQYSPAISELEQAKLDDPLDQGDAFGLAMAYDALGDTVRGDAEIQHWRHLNGRADTPYLLMTDVSRAMGRDDKALLKRALLAAGDVWHVPALDDPAPALQFLRASLNDKGVTQSLFGASAAAEWAAYFNDPKLALQALEILRRQHQRFEAWAWTIWRPVMKDVRHDPGFKKLVRDMGLVDYWRATGIWGAFCKPVGADDFECN
jgi:TolB-like protein/DNA-binding winged helix-turn-helix (wHTH) protein/tetratricopeptide (TPR) repeat protein